MKRNRPFGVTALAFMAGIMAVLSFIHTLQMLNLFPMWFGPVRFFDFNLVGAIMWGFMTLIYIWLVRMLWNLNGQGWLFLVVLAVLNLILAFVSVIGGSTWESMAAGMIINGLILIFLILPNTREAFATRPEPATD